MNDYMYVTDLQGRKCIFFTKYFSSNVTVYIHGNTPEFLLIDRHKGTAEISKSKSSNIKALFDKKSIEPDVTWTLVNDVVDFLVDYLYTGIKFTFSLPDGVLVTNAMFHVHDSITFEMLPPMPIDYINIDVSYGVPYLCAKHIPKPSSGGSDES